MYITFMKKEQQQSDPTVFESAFIQLEESVKKVAVIPDLAQREYELNQEAKRLDIPLDSYRRMFNSVIEQSHSGHYLVRPFKQIDRKLGTLVESWKNISLFKLVALLGQVTLLLAMSSYFIDAPKRHQQAMNEAKQTIKRLEGSQFSQDRINALMLLGQNCEDITGVKAPGAVLSGIELDNCKHWQISPDAFKQFPPQFTKAQPTKLSHANLAGSDLKGANLRGVDLRGANLAKANLADANLAGANLEGANLEGANLRRANLEKAVLVGANLSRSDLGQANLREINMKSAIAHQANLVWATLAGANLREADLSGANLNRADLRGAELYETNLSEASLRYADLRQRANLRKAIVMNADFHEARFWSVSQLERAYGWEKTKRNGNWEANISQLQATPKVVLIKSNEESVYHSYARGMRGVADTKISTVKSKSSGVQAESKTIEQLIAQGVDAILLRPEDPIKSVPSIRAAYEAGVVVITIGDCLNPTDAKRYVFACYESDSFQMGYDLTKLMVKNRKTQQALNLGLVDSVELGRTYDYFRGFEQAMADAKVPWSEVASTKAYRMTDVKQVKEMLQNYPMINLLWAGTDTATSIAVQAVQELGLSDRIKIYGIVNLTPAKVGMLLDANDPLESIVDEHPQQVGAKAVAAAISILNGGTVEYKRNLIPHRVLGSFDRKAVGSALEERLR